MSDYVSDREKYARKIQDEIEGFTTRLASDNEALRVNSASLQAELQKLRDQVALLQDERAAAEARERRLRRELAEIEAHQEQEGRERIRVERRNAELTHLYVACHRLHEGLGRRDLFQAVEEILASIVGCEEFAVYETDTAGEVLRQTEAVGLRTTAPAEVAVGTGRIGIAARDLAIWVAPGGRPDSEDGITACVPLIRAGRAVAVIVLFGLLEHRRRVGEVEREVFEILAHQGGPALLCANAWERERPAGAGA